MIPPSKGARGMTSLRIAVNIKSFQGSGIFTAYTYPDLQSGLFTFDPRLRIIYWKSKLNKLPEILRIPKVGCFQ